MGSCPHIRRDLLVHPRILVRKVLMQEGALRDKGLGFKVSIVGLKKHLRSSRFSNGIRVWGLGLVVQEFWVQGSGGERAAWWRAPIFLHTSTSHFTPEV